MFGVSANSSRQQPRPQQIERNDSKGAGPPRQSRMNRGEGQTGRQDHPDGDEQYGGRYGKADHPGQRPRRALRFELKELHARNGGGRKFISQQAQRWVRRVRSLLLACAGRRGR